MVQCAYLARLRGKPCRVTVTWTKVAMGQALAIAIHDYSNRCLCKAEVKPWLFSKMKGSKVMELDGGNVDIIWDLSSAKFGAGPEPVEGFHVALVYDLEPVLVLGDQCTQEHRVLSDASHSDAVMIARKEHIYAKKVYSAKARFVDIGQFHQISIECDTAGVRDPSLEIRIDKKKVLQVKRLAWKFRGNQTIYVDGLPVEVLWDVHDWLFTSSSGCAVFLFQSGQSMEKFLLRTCSQNGKEARCHSPEKKKEKKMKIAAGPTCQPPFSLSLFSFERRGTRRRRRPSSGHVPAILASHASLSARPPAPSPLSLPCPTGFPPQTLALPLPPLPPLRAPPAAAIRRRR